MGKTTVVMRIADLLEAQSVPIHQTTTQPRYRFFQTFENDFYRALTDQREYSWVGRTDDGYRYPHAPPTPPKT